MSVQTIFEHKVLEPDSTTVLRTVADDDTAIISLTRNDLKGVAEMGIRLNNVELNEYIEFLKDLQAKRQTL